MERIDYILDFCKELGKEMIACGANIERVNLTTEKICHAYGLHDVTCANLTTRILSARKTRTSYMLIVKPMFLHKFLTWRDSKNSIVFPIM